jgi:hypothetical protein
LCDDEAVESVGALTVGKDGSGLCELRDTGDSGVLLVEFSSDDLVLSGANGRENVWLSRVVTVGANTWIVSV